VRRDENTESNKLVFEDTKYSTYPSSFLAKCLGG
jgi:hypothetical protein